MIEETKQTITYAEPYSVTLTRGAKGEYRWEIKVRHADIDAMILQLTDIDNGLRLHFEEKEAE